MAYEYPVLLKSEGLWLALSGDGEVVLTQGSVYEDVICDTFARKRR